MSGFPGVIYDGQGKSLDSTIPDLLQEQLDDYLHRSMVTDRDAAPLARVWLLVNDATPDAIPPVLMIEAVRLVLAGKGPAGAAPESLVCDVVADIVFSLFSGDQLPAPGMAQRMFSQGAIAHRPGLRQHRECDQHDGGTNDTRRSDAAG